MSRKKLRLPWNTFLLFCFLPTFSSFLPFHPLSSLPFLKQFYFTSFFFSVFFACSCRGLLAPDGYVLGIVQCKVERVGDLSGLA